MSVQSNQQGSFLSAPLLAAIGAGLCNEALSAALAGGPDEAIGRALCDDIVIVPLASAAAAENEFRVYTTDSGPAPASVLNIFSSAETLTRFLGDDPLRAYTATSGFALLPFLDQRYDDLTAVVVDEGEPTRREFPAGRVLDWLVSGATEVVAQAQRDLDRPRGRASAYDLALSKQWVSIPLASPLERENQVRRLVAEQTKGLGDQAATLRRDLRAWFFGTVERAAQANGQKMAFLIAQRGQAAVALNLVTYWHELGPETTLAHHQRILERVRQQAAATDAVAQVQAEPGDVVRWLRIRPGSRELGNEPLSLLMLDYWIIAPDRLAAAQIAFSSPQLELEEAITVLADNLVLNGTWRFAVPPAGVSQ